VFVRNASNNVFARNASICMYSRNESQDLSVRNECKDESIRNASSVVFEGMHLDVPLRNAPKDVSATHAS
jgi:hypothetical protein